MKDFNMNQLISHIIFHKMGGGLNRMLISGEMYEYVNGFSGAHFTFAIMEHVNTTTLRRLERR